MNVSNRQLVRGIVVGLVLALGVLTALTVIGDARELGPRFPSSTGPT